MPKVNIICPAALKGFISGRDIGVLLSLDCVTQLATEASGYYTAITKDSKEPALSWIKIGFCPVIFSIFRSKLATIPYQLQQLQCSTQ